MARSLTQSCEALAESLFTRPRTQPASLNFIVFPSRKFSQFPLLL